MVSNLYSEFKSDKNEPNYKQFKFHAPLNLNSENFSFQKLGLAHTYFEAIGLLDSKKDKPSLKSPPKPPATEQISNFQIFFSFRSTGNQKQRSISVRGMPYENSLAAIRKISAPTPTMIDRHRSRRRQTVDHIDL